MLAHAFGQRYTLPLPLLLFVLGGAVAVGASFLVVLPRTVAAPRTTSTATTSRWNRPGRCGTPWPCSSWSR